MSARTARDVVVIGASAGGIPILESLLARIERGIGASLLVVMHRSPSVESRLAEVLRRSSTLSLREPTDGEPLEHDVIYLAPADHHMRIDGTRIALDRGPKMHHTRPAIDPLFISASEHHRERTMGVLLSGNLGDGVAGLVAIKQRGGLSLVQDPREAEWPSMPYNALLYDHVDLVFRVDALPAVLRRLVGGEPVSSAVDGLEAVEREPTPLVRPVGGG